MVVEFSRRAKEIWSPGCRRGASPCSSAPRCARGRQPRGSTGARPDGPTATRLKPDQRAAYVAIRDEYEGYYRRLINEGIAAGEFRAVNVKLATFALMGMLENFDGWFNPDGPLTSDQVGDAFSDLFLAALANDRPAGPWIDETVTSRATGTPAKGQAPVTRARKARTSSP